MTLLTAAAAAVVFGSGIHLLLSRDLVRVVGGMAVVSNAVNLLLVASGQSIGQPPILPVEPGRAVSDPLVQALTLTSIVISFGITAFLLSLVYRIHASDRTVTVDEFVEAEEKEEHRQEREARR